MLEDLAQKAPIMSLKGKGKARLNLAVVSSKSKLVDGSWLKKLQLWQGRFLSVLRQAVSLLHSYDDACHPSSWTPRVVDCFTISTYFHHFS